MEKYKKMLLEPKQFTKVCVKGCGRSHRVWTTHIFTPCDPRLMAAQQLIILARDEKNCSSSRKEEQKVKERI